MRPLRPVAWAILCTGLATASLGGCGAENRGETAPTLVAWQDPEGFPPMHIPHDNPLTVEGIELGRRLFFDPILSADSTVSCASCHHPEHFFTDGKKQSEGIGGAKSKRNALSLVNVGYYYTGLFWDGRAASLEDQAFHPVRDPLEMGLDWNVAEQRLQQSPIYQKLFKKAFSLRSPEQIDSTLAAKALAQFERTLVSSHSRFDSVMQGLAHFTPQEKRGWTIFFDASPHLPAAECSHCHVDPLFSDLSYQNNGVQAPGPTGSFSDSGRAVFTKNQFDQGKFRVPTLRNIFYTAPYMHDGRMETLDEVLDHYVSGGHAAINLSPNVRRLNLGHRDREDLKAFLQTLTDTRFLQITDFKSPGIKK
jgi:cytochrome c peroxidase